jgi:hypothetical protein
MNTAMFSTLVEYAASHDIEFAITADRITIYDTITGAHREYYHAELKFACAVLNGIIALRSNR